MHQLSLNQFSPLPFLHHSKRDGERRREGMGGGFLGISLGMCIDAEPGLAKRGASSQLWVPSHCRGSWLSKSCPVLLGKWLRPRHLLQHLWAPALALPSVPMLHILASRMCAELKTENQRPHLVAAADPERERREELSWEWRWAGTEDVLGRLRAQHPPPAGGQIQVNLCDRLLSLSFESRMPNHGQNRVRAAVANYTAPQVISD